jgi:hypothetical protein
MAEIINLRQARKQRSRLESEKRAADNRLSHGIGKREIQQARAIGKKNRDQLEGHRLEPENPNETPRSDRPDDTA